jgi:hypothetical protein
VDWLCFDVNAHNVRLLMDGRQDPAVNPHEFVGRFSGEVSPLEQLVLLLPAASTYQACM